MNNQIYNILRAGYGALRGIKARIKVGKLKRASDIKILNSEEYSNLFCGYYDHSPFMKKNDHLILVHGNNHKIWRAPKKGSKTDLLLYNWKENRIEKVLGRTSAWNWQQGSRLMWVDDESFIYNDYDPDLRIYIAIKGNVNTDEYRRFEHPIQEMSACQKYYYSISYEALSLIRQDYGYPCKDIENENFTNLGITEVNINDGSSKLIVSIKDLKNATEELLSTKIHKYKINHVLSSLEGNSIIFMFRYFMPNGQKITDVYLYNKVTKTVKLLLNNKGVSHYCWIGTENFVFTGPYKSNLFAYYHFDILNDVVSLMYPSIDGHPFSLKNNKLLTDTYPGKTGIRSLELRSNTAQNMKLESVLFQTYEPWYIWGSQRCDLHPSANSTYWQIDIIQNYRRAVCVGKL